MSDGLGGAELRAVTDLHIRLELGYGALAALQAGRNGDPGILLVPGFTGSKEDFAPLLRPLAEAGFQVTALDLPGQYQSPAAASGGYTVDSLGATVLDAIDILGAPAFVVGHSFGGLVARAAAISRPDRFTGLVLLDSGPAGIQGERAELIDAAQSLVHLGVEGIYDARQAIADPALAPTDPTVVAFLRERFVGSDLTGLVEMGRALRQEPDRTADLRATGLPVHVVCGAADDAWPVPVQEEMALRLDAPFVVIPDAAHSPAVENPPATLAALLAAFGS